ncbi:S9 family peptidase [Sphingopyxis sp. KK2]|uniref:alpha/beta hydrolase family protein n=1 Tax=Sphingopyxis sp. KK2 TaxID=1855727 RepID=UPI00097E5F2E|nr:alpha/beta fold hydrolase [Sphingopyxis sp. KK2]
MIKKMFAAALLASAMGLPVVGMAQDTPGKPVPEKVSLDVLASLPLMSDLQMSPGGTKIAMTLGAGNEFGYAILDLSKPGSKPQIFARASTFKDAGQRDVTNYRWVDDRYLILELASREFIALFGQRVDIGRLAAYDTVTGKTHPLAWDGATADASNILHIDKEKKRILLARQVDDGDTEKMFSYQVDWVDVATGKVLETVQRTNPVVGGWAADGKGVVRMGFGSNRDTGETRYLYRSGPGENFRTVQRVIDKDFTGSGIQPIVFLDQPDMAIVSSNHEGYSAIYKANLATMTIGEKLFSLPGYDVGGAIPNEAENDIVGFAYATDRPRRKFTDPRLAAIQNFLNEDFGEGNANIVSSDDGDKKLVVSMASADQIGSYYLYDVESGKFALIGHRSDALGDGKLNPVKAIRYKASDGLEIEAILTTPRLRAGQKNLPIVVLTHGGPYGVRDYASYDQWAQTVAEQGYVVVQPNYRGSGGYGNEFVKSGRQDGFGTRMQDDLNDVVDYLAAQGMIDPKRACMMGWSYGGYASARAAQRDPARWRCTIAGAGVYDLPMMRDYDKGYLGSFGANYLAKGANSLTDVSPARNTDTKWAPILIVHGVRDPRVPIAQARTLVSRLKGSGKKQGVDFEYIEQPKNGHYGAYFTKEERVEWLGGTSNWLERFNPAYVPSDADYAKKPAADPLIAAAKFSE